MVEIAVFVLVIALIYAVKAAAIMLQRDELVADSAAFSWMSAREEDVQAAKEAQEALEASSATVAVAPFRQVGTAV